MRIAMFTNAYKPGISGVVTSIELFSKGLGEAGHQSHIFAPQYEAYDDDAAYIFRFPSIDLTRQLNISLVWPFRNLIEPTLRGIKPDLIHSHHPIWMGDFAARFARDLGVPLIFTYHSQYEKYAQFYSPIAPDVVVRVTEEMISRYLKWCDHVIAPTESIKNHILQEYDADFNVSVVPTPVDLSTFIRADKEKIRVEYDLKDCRILLYVGRLAQEKEIDLLLHAFSLIWRDRQDVRLLLVGEGPYRSRLEALTHELGLESGVLFIGSVPHERVPDYFASADLFVFASSSETQGLVLVEAMSTGTPVVAVNAPASNDVLDRGGGVLTRPSAEDFAHKVISLLEQDDRRRDLGQEASEAVKRFSIRSSVKSLIDAYELAILDCEKKHAG